MQTDNSYAEFEKDIKELEKLLVKQAEGLQELKGQRIAALEQVKDDHRRQGQREPECKRGQEAHGRITAWRRAFRIAPSGNPQGVPPRSSEPAHRTSNASSRSRLPTHPSEAEAAS